MAGDKMHQQSVIALLGHPHPPAPPVNALARIKQASDAFTELAYAAAEQSKGISPAGGAILLALYNNFANAITDDPTLRTRMVQDFETHLRTLRPQQGRLI